MNNFAFRLREAREKLGLTQKELANQLGITKSAVGNYELGISSPKEEVLLKIFDVLKVEPNYLFQDSFTLDNQLSYEENILVECYRSFNQLGRQKILETCNDMKLLDKYTKDNEKE